jgi:hypothetical protein
VFTNSSFNNRFEHESSLFESIPSKLTSSSRVAQFVYTPSCIDKSIIKLKIGALK